MDVLIPLQKKKSIAFAIIAALSLFLLMSFGLYSQAKASENTSLDYYSVGFDQTNDDLANYLNEARGQNKNAIKVTFNVRNVGDAYVDSKFKEIKGVEVSLLGTEQGPKMQDMGMKKSSGSFTFKSGANIVVKDINFKVPVTVEEGATVTFENCKFELGTINNSGTAKYTGTTVEPENTATPPHTKLAISCDSASQMQESEENTDFTHVYPIKVTGSFAMPDKYDLKPYFYTDEPEGVEFLANADNTAIIVKGKDVAAGEYELRVFARSKEKVNGAIEISNELTLQFTVKPDPSLNYIDIEYREEGDFTRALETAKAQNKNGIRILKNLERPAVDKSPMKDVHVGSNIKVIMGYNDVYNKLQDPGWQFGYYQYANKLIFDKGADLKVKNLQFSAFKNPATGREYGSTVVVEEGAKVVFENIVFDKTPEIHGDATFKNCTFKDGIKDFTNTAKYTDGTLEPQNKAPKVELSINNENVNKAQEAIDKARDDNQAFEVRIPLEISGILKDSAEITAKANPENPKLHLSVSEDHKSLIIKGDKDLEKNKVGITVSAQVSGEEAITSNFALSIKKAYKPLSVNVKEESKTKDLKVGKSFTDKLPIVLDGTLMKKATVSVASIDPKDNGITAEIKDSELIVTGKNIKAGTASITVKASAKKSEDTMDECTQVVTYEVKTYDKVAPTLTAEGKSEFVKQSKDGLIFKSNAPLESLTDVKVDGKTIDAKNYEKKSGSTIITLKPDYLNTLLEGKHNLTLSFKESAKFTQSALSAKFTIKAAPASTDTNKKPSADSGNTSGKAEGTLNNSSSHNGILSAFSGAGSGKNTGVAQYRSGQDFYSSTLNTDAKTDSKQTTKLIASDDKAYGKKSLPKTSDSRQNLVLSGLCAASAVAFGVVYISSYRRVKCAK